MDNNIAYAQNTVNSVDTASQLQWEKLKEHIAKHDRAIGHTLDFAHLVGLDGKTFRIRFLPEDAFTCKTLLNPTVCHWINQTADPFSVKMECSPAKSPQANRKVSAQHVAKFG